MLTQDEELWEKELPLKIEQFLQSESIVDSYMTKTVADNQTKSTSQITHREKHRAVTYCVPQNSGVQIYDYKVKQSRIIFGPEMVMLNPDEHFTMINLSKSIFKSLAFLALLYFLAVFHTVISNKKISIMAIILYATYIAVCRLIR
jgi:major vault protein